MGKVLIVDDEQTIGWGLKKLCQNLGHEALTAASAEEALEAVGKFKPQAVLLDVRLPGMDGLSAMQPLREAAGEIPIVIMTAYGDLETAVEAVRRGAFDYLVKPFELKAAQRVIERALAMRAATTPAAVEARPTEPDQLVGRTPAMQEVFKRIALVAPSDACVHLHGESGTGKELVARAIHRYSRRNQGPFIAVNLAALSPSLAESELFGHVKGAFTGADQVRRGLLEAANGGTIFLDEVADIPMALQVKLLRSLEQGEVLPVGADRPRTSDFRVISATHQDLTQLSALGTFRHDLYFRLSTFQIDIPALRQRSEDLPDLAQYFLNRISAKNGRPVPTLARETLDELHQRNWPGNVREFRNAIEHAVIVSRDGPILPEHLPAPLSHSSPASPSPSNLITLLQQWTEAQLTSGEDSEASDLYEQLLQLVEPPVLEVVLRKFHGQCATAARRMGLHRMTLRKKLDLYNIQNSP